MRAELFFPNLHLELKALDFGCILNNTEVTHSLTMTNIGPIEVIYKWSFLVDSDTIIERMNTTDKSFLNSINVQSGEIEADGKVKMVIPSIEVTEMNANSVENLNEKLRDEMDRELSMNEVEEKVTENDGEKEAAKFEQIVKSDEDEMLPNYEDVVLKFFKLKKN